MPTVTEIAPAPLTSTPSWTARIASALEARWPLLLFGLIDFYLVFTAFRGLRRFWYDELFTYYMCRLPSMQAVWSALKHGADLNPPLFYAVTRGSMAVFGDGELAVRVPAIAGFLLMMLCVFRFVSRYGNRFAALTAMTVPLISGAYYYAQEARPYGMVLGFAGLAAVCWQSAVRNGHRKTALLGLSGFLAGALMSHCYAAMLFIPFALAEASRLWIRRRMDWPVLAALALPCPLVLVYLPMFAATQKQSFDNPVFRPEWSSIPAAYVDIAGPLMWPLIAVLIILAVLKAQPSAAVPTRENSDCIPKEEIVLATAFGLMPVFTVLFAMFVTRIFQDRYAVSAIVGCSILLGILVTVQTRTFRVGAAAVAAVVLGIFGWNSAQYLIGLRPAVSTSGVQAARPFTFAAIDPNIPIVVTNPLLFLEFDHYESPQVAARLYYLNDSDSAKRLTGLRIFDEWFPRLPRWFPIRAHCEDYRLFVSGHSRFAVISEYQSSLDWAMRKMLEDGIPLQFRGEFPLQHGPVVLAEVDRTGAARN